MKAKALLMVMAAGLGGCFQTERVAGGSTEVGNSITVAGTVFTLDGAPARNARVTLLPRDYNPVQADSLPAAWSVGTDSLGAYRIAVGVPGLYTLEAVDADGRNLAMVQGLEVNMPGSGGTGSGRTASGPILDPGRMMLAEPGSIEISMSGMDRDADYFIPGTRVQATADSQARAAGRLILSKVPAGKYSEIMEFTPGVQARNILGRGIEVGAGSGKVLDLYHEWRFLRRVVVNAAKAGITDAVGLGHVPVLIRLDKANFDFAEAKRSGEDIRVARLDGRTPLPFEIENWDALNGQATIWVGLDSLAAGNQSGEFLLYSGNLTATGTGQSAAVFDTAAGFVGAWHMREYLRDATDFHADGIDHGTRLTAGLIGLARDFDGDTQFVSVPAHPGMDFGTGDFFASAFIQPAGFGTTAQVFSKRGMSTAFEIQISVDGRATALIDTGSEGKSFNLYGKTALQAGQWYQVALLRAGGKASLYLNGVLEVGPFDLPMNVSSESDFLIGADPMMPRQEMFKGRIDEVQLSRLARSEEWIRFAYATQKSGSQAVTVTRIDP